MQNEFTCNSFYSIPVILQSHSTIIASNGDVLARLFSNVVPQVYLEKLENTAKQHLNAVKQKHTKTNIRGTITVLQFGSYVERGGSGDIWTVKEHKTCPGFLQSIDELGQFVSAFFTRICPEVANNVGNIPANLCLWKNISLMFWNAVCEYAISHKDTRDLHWCLILPFGTEEYGEVELTYLNTTIKCKRGDMYLLNSSDVYHKSCVLSNRQVLIFTNQSAVVKRYCKINVANMFSELNKL